MKFLLMIRPGTESIPREQAVGLVRAAKEFVNARIADGTIDCAYLFVEGGGFAIFNADSHEKAFDVLREWPLYPFFSLEVKALCDWSYGYDKLIEFWQKLAS